MKKSRFALALLTATSLAHAANYETYVVHTYGDPALATIVQNELNTRSGGTAVMYQDQLVIRATPADYRAVSALISQIDTAPSPLTVSVKAGNQVSQSTHANQVNIGIARGVWANGNYQNSSYSGTGNSEYTARTLSGGTLTISQSTLVGLAYPAWHGNANRLWLSVGTAWISLVDGFRATPRLLPNGQIALQIHQSARNTNGTLGSQSLDTTVTLNRGQWTQIGKIRSDNTQSYAGGGYARSSTSQASPIWVKVD